MPSKVWKRSYGIAMFVLDPVVGLLAGASIAFFFYSVVFDGAHLLLQFKRKTGLFLTRRT